MREHTMYELTGSPVDMVDALIRQVGEDADVEIGFSTVHPFDPELFRTAQAEGLSVILTSQRTGIEYGFGLDPREPVTASATSVRAALVYKDGKVLPQKDWQLMVLGSDDHGQITVSRCR